MTRISIVASSEELRATLAAALGAHPAFDVVAVGASMEDVSSVADVVVVARSTGAVRSGARSTPDVARHSERDAVLTTREREILELLAQGLGNKQVAARLGISTHTVKTHLELLFEKLGVSTRAEAVAQGVKRGLLLF
jgi:DNA-binding CsgD family transcriptional regulator